MNKTKLLIAPLLVVPFLASCKGEINVEPYKVRIPDTNGVTVSPGTVTKGKDYVGTISMAVDVDPDHVLPAALDKVTSGNKELQTKDYTYTLKDDKLSADFTIPAANIVGDVDVYLSPVSKEPYKVTEDEFNDALSFKNEQYLQIDGETSMVAGMDPMKMVAKASPTVFYSLADTPLPAPMPSFYQETFIAKNQDGSYDKYEKQSKTGTYTKTAGTAEEFKTPQQMNLLEQLEAAGVTYESFTYDENTKGYTATYTTPSATEETTTTLKFENKKLISEIDIVPILGTTSTSTFSYKEETPELPVVPPVENYTLTFTGTDCFMVDDEGEHITEKEFEAGQTASYSLVGKTEEYEIPLFNHVDVTYTETGDPFDGTYSYDADTGDISIKMTADVTVTARSDKVVLTYQEAYEWVGKNYQTASRELSGYKAEWDYEDQEPNSNTFPAEFTQIGLYGKDLDYFVGWTLVNAIGVKDEKATNKTGNDDLTNIPPVFAQAPNLFKNAFDQQNFAYFGSLTGAKFILNDNKDALTVLIETDAKNVPAGPSILTLHTNNIMIYEIDSEGFLESYSDSTLSDTFTVTLLNGTTEIKTTDNLGKADFTFSVTPVVSEE